MVGSGVAAGVDVGEIEESPSSPSGHDVSSAQLLSPEAGCGSEPETLSQVVAAKPNTSAAAFSLAVRDAQDLMDDQGCCSPPDKLSHETWVYPNIFKAVCSLTQPKKSEFE